jgi:hypothetical protein
MSKFSLTTFVAIFIALTVISCKKDKEVTGVQLDKTDVLILVDNTVQLTATVLPSDATNKNVTWKSSNTEAATVSSSGLVTAKSWGFATITVSTEDGKKTATCIVKVKNHPDDPDPEPEPDPNNPGTFVSKEASKRNVLLEEFTGNECVNCPRGHKTVDGVLAANPKRAFAINTHAGFMSKAYRTPEGTAIDNAFNNVNGMMGYPKAAISRMGIDYGGGSIFYVVGDDGYAQVAAQVLNMDAYVNVAARSVIDKNSRELKVTVQAYFTAAPAAGTVNMINVALVQNNVKGPQTGASTYYPAMGTNSSYTHNHMLRKNITGTWGEEMPANTLGTLYDKTFTYTIPAVIGEGADAVTAVLEDLEIIVYVTEKVVQGT